MIEPLCRCISTSAAVKAPWAPNMFASPPADGSSVATGLDEKGIAWVIVTCMNKCKYELTYV